MTRCIAPLLLALASIGCGGASFRDPETMTRSVYAAVDLGAKHTTVEQLWDWLPRHWRIRTDAYRQPVHADWVTRQSDFGTLRSSVVIDVSGGRVITFRFEMHVENRGDGMPDSAWAEIARAEWDALMAETPWGPLRGRPEHGRPIRVSSTRLGREAGGAHPSVP